MLLSFTNRLRSIVSGQVLDSAIIQNERLTHNPAIQLRKPFTWWISSTFFQLFCFVFGIYLACYTSNIVLGFDAYGTGHYRTFKLRVDKESKSNFSNLTVSLNLLQLTHVGCIVWSSHGSLELLQKIAEGLPITLRYAIDIDGFELIFKASTSFTAHLELQGSNDNGTSWNTIASSNSRFVAEGVRFLEGSTFIEEEKLLRFENMLLWPLVLDSAVNSVLLAFGCFSTALSGIFQRPSLGKMLFALSAALQAVNNCIVFAGYLSIGQPLLVFDPCIDAVSLSGITWTLFAAEISFADTLLATGLASC